MSFILSFGGEREDGAGVGNVPDGVRRDGVFPFASSMKDGGKRAVRRAALWGQKESWAAALWGDLSQSIHLAQKAGDDMSPNPPVLKVKNSPCQQNS